MYARSLSLFCMLGAGGAGFAPGPDWIQRCRDSLKLRKLQSKSIKSLSITKYYKVLQEFKVLAHLPSLPRPRLVNNMLP